MAERNSIAAEKYRSLSIEQKQHYCELASSSSVDGELEINKWHETKRVLSNMNHNVSTIESVIQSTSLNPAPVNLSLRK